MRIVLLAALLAGCSTAPARIDVSNMKDGMLGIDTENSYILYERGRKNRAVATIMRNEDGTIRIRAVDRAMVQLVGSDGGSCQ